MKARAYGTGCSLNQYKQATAMLRAGESTVDIAYELGLSRDTVEDMRKIYASFLEQHRKENSKAEALKRLVEWYHENKAA